MTNNKKDDVMIVGGKRTAIGNFMGGLSSVPAPSLAAAVITDLLQSQEDQGLGRDQWGAVGEVILGQILSAGLGQGPARQAAMAAGLPEHVPALGVNILCGSGLKAVAMAADSIRAGSYALAIAGGMESMSRAPHAALMRAGLSDSIKMGDAKLVDTMMSDALICAFNHYHMGQTAENIAKAWGISRAAMDAFAYESQTKARAAIDSGAFTTEIVPVRVKVKKTESLFAQDEYPRQTSLDQLASLKPAFAKEGCVTAGNASGINDGAAAVLLGRRDWLDQHHVSGRFIIRGHATVGVDPAIMGIGPVAASRQALARAGWQVGDVELIESNEAFAAQSLAVIKDLGFPPDRVNVHGGAIALGHPVGASGARILVTLMHAMAARGAKRGLATLCVGGGMGVAMAIEAA